VHKSLDVKKHLVKANSDAMILLIDNCSTLPRVSPSWGAHVCVCDGNIKLGRCWYK